MCLYPKLITNPKYKATKKNKGIIPQLTDQRIKYVPIACQNCMECKKKKAREWNLRLQEDIKHNKNAKFITLTLSNWNYKVIRRYVQIHKIKSENEYIIDNQIATIAIRRFLERWRKKYKKSLRHWAITELGHNGTENIHIHALVWTTNLEKIPSIWKYGFVWTGKQEKGHIIQYVNTKTINYITKYVTKVDFKHRGYKPIILTSPGIGHNYTTTHDSRKNKFNGIHTIETYRCSNGQKAMLPIYWRNKIYTEEDREQLWINKINKQERWIMGERISIKYNYDEYDKTLKFYQRKNKQLGYDSDQIKWDVEQYEQQRRKLLNQKRLDSTIRKHIAQQARLAGEAVKHEYRLNGFIYSFIYRLFLFVASLLDKQERVRFLSGALRPKACVRRRQGANRAVVYVGDSERRDCRRLSTRTDRETQFCDCLSVAKARFSRRCSVDWISLLLLNPYKKITTKKQRLKLQTKRESQTTT